MKYTKMRRAVAKLGVNPSRWRAQRIGRPTTNLILLDSDARFELIAVGRGKRAESTKTHREVRWYCQTSIPFLTSLEILLPTPCGGRRLAIYSCLASEELAGRKRILESRLTRKEKQFRLDALFTTR